ncbi:heavy metal translocating P-type ATPase [Thalassotalea profundi]|uniref:Copper-translocating P-type ATPase n=1 Tax=Thalassotalea profundi TaxID=2036687 RepID=A0ABQ3IJL2_9GAMM|nr:heavy metal translocating P-type ATPase [Thalassotalea profundi]GHE83872.1 copper-translocating P-type ATPase [Thalassotalea profundi]
MSDSCYHCGEVIPKGISLSVTIDKVAQPMCCTGCQAIAETIVANGLTEYYRFRTDMAPKGDALIPEELARKKLLDDETLQDEFTFKTDLYKEAILTIEGINCAACAWLIEMQLEKLKGIISINVNATTQRATVKWTDSKINLSDILTAIDKIGYKALPFKASTIEARNIIQSKRFIKRLGIAGILMMQVMMIAIGLYFGAFSDMSADNLIYLRWTSLLLTSPIVTYGAFPFYVGAINALKIKRLSMDVPVSIAISLAFSASAWATISQQGEVYFESVSMFTFLLLIGKFLEFRARTRAAEVSANLLKLMPMTATKIVNDNEEFIAAKKLLAQDLVIVKPGEIVPADGIVIYGQSQLNEAMLSGEQRPVDKKVGDNVFAGTVNGDGNITIEVKHNSQHSFLSQLIRLSETSQAHKPKLAKLSDKIAQYFVAIILLCAILTALYWQQHLPEEAFWITLSVLVATCPCALSLATPTALTCATTRLNKDGIMIKSGHVMETVPKLNCIAFDKTGTLTSGDFEIYQCNVIDENLDKTSVLAISAALESYSEHPIAKAFTTYRDFNYKANNVKVVSGSGVEGIINNTLYKIGKPAWLLPPEQLKDYANIPCLLMKDDQIVASILIEDKIRDDAKALIAQLKAQDIITMMLSGDNQSGCDKIQQQVLVDHVHSSLSAADKMELLLKQQQTHTVAMVGDGVNDSPVFGAAHVSFAMGGGTDVAKSGADVILLNNKLSAIKTLRNVAFKTKRIIWQNYSWAFGYNAIILPLAMSGHVTPYMAVIGMSFSSILVITNSLRLLKKG